MILRDLFKKQAREIPNGEALVFKEKRITYKQYDEMTDRVAMGLLKLGVQRGDRIGIYGPLWPEIVMATSGRRRSGPSA
jgi:acyl-coenzyme A synthetase/AMP-(fatty) acid ligase